MGEIFKYTENNPMILKLVKLSDGSYNCTEMSGDKRTWNSLTMLGRYYQYPYKIPNNVQNDCPSIINYINNSKLNLLIAIKVSSITYEKNTCY